MVGPSSSHTAGACRLGFVVQAVAGGLPDSARICLHGSFAMTGEGHGTKLAILGGLLGLLPDNPRIREAERLATEAGLEWEFYTCDLGADAHPNSARFEVWREGEELQIVGSSIGGGRIKIEEIDGFAVDLSGSLPTVVVLAASDQFQVLARNSLGHPSRATPAVSDGTMYIRTYSHLFSLGGS